MERGSAFRTRIWEREGCVSTEPKPSRARAQQFSAKPTEDPMSCAKMTEQGQPARPCPGSEPRGGAAFPQESLPETTTLRCQARSRSNHLLKIPSLPKKLLPPLWPGAPVHTAFIRVIAVGILLFLLLGWLPQRGSRRWRDGGGLREGGGLPGWPLLSGRGHSVAPSSLLPRGGVSWLWGSQRWARCGRDPISPRYSLPPSPSQAAKFYLVSPGTGQPPRDPVFPLPVVLGTDAALLGRSPGRCPQSPLPPQHCHRPKKGHWGGPPHRLQGLSILAASPLHPTWGCCWPRTRSGAGSRWRGRPRGLQGVGPLHACKERGKSATAFWAAGALPVWRSGLQPGKGSEEPRGERFGRWMEVAEGNGSAPHAFGVCGCSPS